MLLAHERHGHGRPLVLVHGITERGESWRPLIGPLAERFEVLVVDLRGHGDSPSGDSYDPVSLATDVHDTVEAVGLGGGDPPLLVGHSLGGVVVSAYAALFGAAGVIDVDQPLRLAGFKEALAPIEPMVRGDQASCELAVGMVFESMQGPLPADEVTRVGALRRVDQSVVAGVWGTVFDSTEAELDAQVGALAGGVRAPFLSLHGIDPGDDYAAWLTSVVPQAEVEVWADHGHYPHLVDPARFVARVEAFAADC